LHHKKVGARDKELKGAATPIEIKKYFYKQMPEIGWDIYSVTLNKERVTDHLKTKSGKKKLYNFLAHFIITKTPLSEIKSSNISFVIDKCKNKEEIKDFNQYMENQLNAILPLETSLYITHESSTENYCIQAVDLFCWGIAKKYKDNDLTWYNNFKQKIKYDEMYFSKKKW
jgi:hypothetical protein